MEVTLSQSSSRSRHSRSRTRSSSRSRSRSRSQSQQPTNNKIPQNFSIVHAIYFICKEISPTQFVSFEYLEKMIEMNIELQEADSNIANIKLIGPSGLLKKRFGNTWPDVLISYGFNIYSNRNKYYISISEHLQKSTRNINQIVKEKKTDAIKIKLKQLEIKKTLVQLCRKRKLVYTTNNNSNVNQNNTSNSNSSSSSYNNNNSNTKRMKNDNSNVNQNNTSSSNSNSSSNNNVINLQLPKQKNTNVTAEESFYLSQIQSYLPNITTNQLPLLTALTLKRRFGPAGPALVVFFFFFFSLPILPIQLS